ncbi:uncharacterized protein DUF433 [Flavobacterium endophyticum]|uniref:Uncharacterized protein DUF433 n=1 Tax=Flavobacterium endophyticum TaxID=1540163 RepID=A0A495MP40_9FLAO|nr:DUF433 domain-containing protein [Flavobacterium endophyticum]RKS26583.1 uncharacterized protein DUF433 [Flavobacterium endophyticum]
MKFENKIDLGIGIYTISDIASILHLKYFKVERLLNEYWDKRFSDELGKKYSWSIGKSKAVSFHTLVEFYIFFQLRESGVSTQQIIKAHSELSNMYETAFPFAVSQIIESIRCVGKRIVFELKSGDIVDLNATKQLNLKFIQEFAKKIVFDKNNLAEKFYPMGKKSSIVVNPHNQFGQPVIDKTNIFPETIYNLYKSKESKKFIAASYDLSLKQVDDAIAYCKPAA